MRNYIAALAFLLSSPAIADDYVAIVEQAFAEISDDYHEEWAFTESVMEDGVTVVSRFDPSQPADERWKLISVDGEQPTDEEIADYVDGRDDEFHGNDDENDSAIEIVDLDTLELLEETNDAWVFGFVPNMIDQEDEDDEDGDVAAKFMQQVEGTLRINRHTNSLEHIDLRNDKPIRPMFSVKISRFRTHLAFGPADGDGPIVPLSIDVEVKGRAMLVIGINEAESTRYYGYEYVGS